jgi:hypothetical protein
MNFFWFIKPKHTLVFIILLMASLISACGSGGSAAPTHSNASNNGITNSYKDKDSNVNDQTTISSDDTIQSSQPSSSTADINLSWVAPSEREDNTAISLSEISGYKIYYGTSPGSYSNSVNISDSTASSYKFTNFTKGTYYFVITTRDTEGRESRFSSSISVQI